MIYFLKKHLQDTTYALYDSWIEVFKRQSSYYTYTIRYLICIYMLKPKMWKILKHFYLQNKSLSVKRPKHNAE